MGESLRTRISNNRFLITGIAAAMAYWVVESIVMVLAFGGDGFVEELFRADLHELWMRSLATLMIVGFGAYAQQANTRIRRTQGDLKESEERNRVEKALRVSEGRFSRIFEEGPMGMAISDAEGRFVLVNDRLCEMLGYGEGELVGLTLNDLADPEDLPLDRATAARLNSGEVRRFKKESRYLTKLGESLWCSATIARLVDEGTSISWVTMLEDISERRRAQERSLVSLREKDVLLQEIHHRVKNNLQVISSILDMSSLRTQDEQAIGLLTDARAKVHTMGLIHSQLYRGQRFDRINMNSHVRDLAQYLSLVYGEDNDVNVAVHAGDVDLSLTQAIPCALALSELVSNSFKHAFKERHGGSLEITVEDAPGNTIVLTVKDDGCGLPDEVDFFTADSLGLRLVRNLIQNQLRGSVQVNRGAGTEFVVTFQREEETDVESPGG